MKPSQLGISVKLVFFLMHGSASIQLKESSHHLSMSTSDTKMYGSGIRELQTQRNISAKQIGISSILHWLFACMQILQC